MAKLKFQQSLVSPLLKKMGYYQCWKCLSEMPFFRILWVAESLREQQEMEIFPNISNVKG